VATLNVTLPADLIDFVQSEIANGSYASADEMVSEALLMLQRETELVSNCNIGRY
jgi:antitoxin ParD1/3/4